MYAPLDPFTSSLFANAAIALTNELPQFSSNEGGFLLRTKSNWLRQLHRAESIAQFLHANGEVLPGRHIDIVVYQEENGIISIEVLHNRGHVLKSLSAA